MQIELGTFFAVAVPTVLGLVWLIRLEGRINVGDERQKAILDRLERIENKQDRLLNGHGKA